MAMAKIITCRELILTQNIFAQGWPDYSLSRDSLTGHVRYNFGLRTYRITTLPGNLALFSPYDLARIKSCGRTKA